MKKIRTTLAGIFPALTERNYQLHFFGQLVAFSGLWLQLMAQSWRVHEITHSAAWVGFIVAFPFAISSMLTPFGGIIADRFDKRKVLYCTNAFSAILCFSLAAMFFFGCETLWGIIAVNLFFGIMLGVDNPTRNSFIPDLISKENIGSGIALNGAMIMMAQVIGPGIAGGLLAIVGIGWTYIASGFTTAAVIITLPFMRPVSYKKANEHPFKMLWLGLEYTFSQPTIRLCVILAGVIGTFSFSYRAILPVITKEIYTAGPQVMSMLAFAAGLGSFTGSVLVSANSKKLRFRLQVLGGSLIAGSATLVFSAVSVPVLGMTLLFFAGMGFSLGFATVRATSQIISEPAMRGRVTGLTVMFFFGGMSLGNFATGCLAKAFGCPAAMAICGTTFLILASTMFMSKNVEA